MASKAESSQTGCRWLHAPPSGAEFAKWFQTNVKLHDGMEHQNYVNGIVLISNKETVEETRTDSQGNTSIVETKRLVYTPYPQVDTRISYFWDYCQIHGYLGETEILTVKEQSKGLPPGVFASVFKDESGRKEYTYLGASARVRIYERDLRSGGKGRDVILPAHATKMVRLHSRWGPDINAPMAAPTGAIGRALGFAGMLVVPGAGVSTAEDMRDAIEARTEPAVPGPVPTPDLPVPGPVAEPETASATEKLESQVAELASELQSKYPKMWAQICAWAQERGLDLQSPAPAALRPLERQLRTKLAQAQEG